MNFENLIINAIGGQNGIVLRQLMEAGLLNTTQYCVKDHVEWEWFSKKIKNNGEFYEL